MSWERKKQTDKQKKKFPSDQEVTTVRKKYLFHI